MKKELQYIGKITGTFGIKGELKVYSESDFKEFRFRPGAHLILKKARIHKEVVVSTMRFNQKNILITIDEKKDINEVIDLVGLDIYTTEEAPLNEDEMYVDDLIGLKVYNQNEEYLGIVNDIISIPSNDILEVIDNEKKILIPFIDDFIESIDEEKIIINEIEGLR